MAAVSLQNPEEFPMAGVIEAADRLVTALTRQEAWFSQELTNAVSNRDLGKAKLTIRRMEEAQALQNGAEKLKAEIVAFGASLSSPIQPNEPLQAFTPGHLVESDGRKQDRTNPASMNAKRNKIISQLEMNHGIRLQRQSPAIYRTENNAIGIVCTMSKWYAKNGGYWYAFHPEHDEYLATTTRAFFVLGMMDLPIAVALPLEVVRENLDKLNVTVKPGGRRRYWHFHISRSESGGLSLKRANGEPPLLLDPYVVQIAG
jgi:hypothetical protein